MLISSIISLILSLNMYMSAIETKPLTFDFGNETGKVRNWGSVNDGVMGGRSTGKTSYSDDALIFEGSISFANNGGFASVRCPYNDFDLSKYRQIRIRYRVTGQVFAFSLNTDSRFYMPNYRVYLPNSPIENEWVEQLIPLQSFKQHRMGSPTGMDISSEALDKVIQMTFISAEKKEGPFRLEIDYLSFLP